MAYAYRYQEKLHRTAAVLDGEEVAIVLRPSRRYSGEAYEIGFFPNHEDDGNPIVAEFTPQALGAFIAEAQRMLHGCFEGKWPRPVETTPIDSLNEWRGVEDIEHDDLTFDELLGDPEPAPKQGLPETVGALIEHLEENYSASSRLNNVSVNTDECVIRIR